MAVKKKIQTKKKRTPAARKSAARKKAPVKAKASKPRKAAAKKSVPKKSIPAKKTVSRAKAPARKTSGTKKKTAGAAEKREGRLLELKKNLLMQREAIVREAKAEIAKYMSGENRQLVDTALDEGDWAVVDISEDINLMRLGAHRKALHGIDESLRKIREGTYGICEECGEEISQKRLKVLPTATLCVSCQGSKEQLEAIERQEET